MIETLITLIAFCAFICIIFLFILGFLYLVFPEVRQGIKDDWNSKM